MAGFFIPAGRAIADTTGAIAQGREEQQKEQLNQTNIEGNQLQNQLLKQQLGMGGLDPKTYLRLYMKKIEDGQQAAGIRAYAQQVRASGDNVRADQLEQTANLLDSQVPIGPAGNLTEAIKSNWQQIGEALGVQNRQANLGRANDAATQRWQDQMDAYMYGNGPYPGPKPPPPIAGPPGASIGLTPPTGFGGLPPFRGPAPPGVSYPPGSADPYTAGARAYAGGGSSAPTAAAAPAPMAGPGAPAPMAAGEPPPRKPLHTLSADDVVAAQSSHNPAIQKEAKAEMLKRKQYQMTPKDQIYVNQVEDAQTAARVVGAKAAALGPVNVVDFKLKAMQFAAGGWGLSNPYREYFTSLGNVFWNLWNAGNASKGSGGGGLGLLNKLDQHFPHGVENYFPDSPSQAVGKVHQLLLDPTTSSFIRHKDKLLRRQWIYDHGDTMPYMPPEDEKFLKDHWRPD